MNFMKPIEDRWHAVPLVAKAVVILLLAWFQSAVAIGFIALIYGGLPVLGSMLVLLALEQSTGTGVWLSCYFIVGILSPFIGILIRPVPPAIKGQSLGQDAWRRIKKDKWAVICMAIIYFYSVVAILCKAGLVAADESVPVSVERHAWVKGEWKLYKFQAGENLPDGLREQAPPLEYQPPSLYTRVLWGFGLTGNRGDFRRSLGLGPIPTNDDLEAQLAAYARALEQEEDPPPITIAKGDYSAPGPDGLYPDERNRRPGWLDYPLGTDFLARDVFKRVLHGTRIAMSVGFVTCVIAIPIGTFFGALAGFYGGWVDETIVLFYSTVASIPGLLLLLAFTMVVSKGIFGVYLALGMTSWVSLCRLVRGEFIKHKEREYVVAARSLGASNFSCIFKHILPNVFHILIINFSLRFVYAVQSEVILSYLGVGVNDQPSWGVMINDAKLELARGVWWQLAAATAAMFLVVLALNIFGDILRDALDPKLRD